MSKKKLISLYIDESEYELFKYNVESACSSVSKEIRKMIKEYNINNKRNKIKKIIIDDMKESGKIEEFNKLSKIEQDKMLNEVTDAILIIIKQLEKVDEATRETYFKLLEIDEVIKYLFNLN